MRTILFAFSVALALSCRAQFTINDGNLTGQLTPGPITGGGGLNDVTNLVGYPALSFWLPGTSTYHTNGTGPYTCWLDDLMGKYSLGPPTNTYHTTYFPFRTIGGLNGHDVLTFNNIGSYPPYLFSNNLTNTQPWELLIVARYTGSATPAQNQNLATSSGAPTVWMIATQSTANLIVNESGVYQTDGAIPVSSWVIYDFVMSGANSAIYTNGILALSGNFGANALNGMTIGSGGITGWIGDVAGIVMYTNGTGAGGIPGLDGTARAKVYNGLKFYFGL